jgi:hypothetical protein
MAQVWCSRTSAQSRLESADMKDSASSLISLGASIFEMDGNDADLSTKAFGVYRHFQQRGGTAANSRS